MLLSYILPPCSLRTKHDTCNKALDALKHQRVIRTSKKEMSI